MASVIYNCFKKNCNGGTDYTDWTAGTIKCMLVTSSYSPNIDTHKYKSDVTNEVSGAGYTAGGASLSSRTVTQDNTNDRGSYDAADVNWSSSTVTARAAVIYKDTGTASTSPLICYVDFGSNYSSNNGNFTITWATDGVLTLT